MPTEPCRHCGQETAAGTRLFSGRVRVVGPPDAYVCAVCLDDHPIRDRHGMVLSRERLAALSYVVHHDGSGGG
jgi:hypothetical protein